jgi:dTDP-4-amino-4,6-dideoxygalactose transaminase
LTALADPAGHLDRFRAVLAGYTGRPHCVLVSSGRAALTIVLIALKRLSDRREVVVPAYGCPSVVQSVFGAGLEPVFCDVSAETLAFDPDDLDRVMSRRPLAVVPTHLYGLPHPMESCIALGRTHGVFVIEDAAQALGARADRHVVGTQGDAGFYSFGRGKCLPIGRGGAIVASERVAPAIAATTGGSVLEARGRRLASVPALLAYGLATCPLGWWFVARSPLNPAHEGMDASHQPPVRLGGLSPEQAGIGISMLERLGDIQALQRRTAQRLMAELAGSDVAALPTIAPDVSPVFLRLPVIVDRRERADRLFQSLWTVGVSKSYYRTLPELYASRVNSDPRLFPGATRLADCLLTLPTHPYVEDADVARIGDAFRHTADRGRPSPL